MIKKALQWHPAFQAVLQIELAEDGAGLAFHKEYNLSEKPLRLDTLIIWERTSKKSQKTIGRIFKTYNIVEYKSPGDYFSVNDFYKVIGYACLYQSDTEKVLEIAPSDLTISLIGSHYPRTLVRHLEENLSLRVHKAYSGVYYVEGFIFRIQMVVIGQLPKQEYVWLSRLRKGLTVKEDIEVLAKAYYGKEKNPYYTAAMDLIIRANIKQYEEGKDMCEALRELFAEELKEREAIGLQRGIEEGIQEGMQEGMMFGANAMIDILLPMGIEQEEIIRMIAEKMSLDRQTVSGLVKARFH